MSHFRNVFHHFAFTHPQIDLSSLESRGENADNVLSPKVDLRECSSAYFLEAELPGVHGSDDIEIRWLDGSTLQIQVTIQKTDLEAEWGDAMPHENPHKKISGAAEYENQCDWRNGFGKKVQEREEDQQHSPEGLVTRFWLDERRTGVYMRNYSFTVAVETKGIRVRLRQGLLKVFVPKMDDTTLETKHIPIEVI
jgi:HSP20 family molecular chaperone IbpA